MSNIGLLLLVMGGLWLYSYCYSLVYAKDCGEELEDVELHFANDPDAAQPATVPDWSRLGHQVSDA